MLINTFWKILIKVVGLLLLFNGISVIPQFTSTISITNDGIDTQSLLYIWLMLIGTLFIYVLVVRLFLFKTEWIIKVLKLNDNFNEDKIDLNIQTSVILTIAIIVIGGLMIADSFPHFCSTLFDYLRQKSMLRDYPDASWLVYDFFKSLIGYLLLTNGKNLSKLILKNSSE